MCMGGGGSAKVPTPKPAPLPPPLPAPPPPPPAAPPPREVLDVSAKPDIKIGAAKKAAATDRKSRSTPTSNRAGASLTIGDSQGMSL